MICTEDVEVAVEVVESLRTLRVVLVAAEAVLPKIVVGLADFVGTSVASSKFLK